MSIRTAHWIFVWNIELNVTKILFNAKNDEKSRKNHVPFDVSNAKMFITQ